MVFSENDIIPTQAVTLPDIIDTQNFGDEERYLHNIGIASTNNPAVGIY